MSGDPWAERHPRLGGLRGLDREQVQAGAEGYNAALAAVRPLYDRVCAERDAARALAIRLGALLDTKDVWTVAADKAMLALADLDALAAEAEQ